MIPFMICLGKIVADAAVSLRLLEEHLARHIFVAGGTGGGKSKLLEQFVRQLVRQEAGVTIIDPHGDLTLALMIYLALRGVDPARVHYVAPGADRCCAIDPFAGAPRDCSLNEYEAWLSSACDRVISAFLRNVSAADRELMKRLKRWAKNIFFVCGYDVDGTHEGLAKALVLTDPENSEFERIIERVRPHACRTDFGREVMLDFDKLRDTKGARQREQWIESTINMLKEVLGPVMRLVFGQHAPALSQRDIILSRGIQLVNVAKSDFLSREQANAIGGLIINLLIHAAENIGQERPFEARIPHYLIIDEAENFIGDDLRAGFGELRKFKLVLVISFQDLSCMQKGDNMDLKPKVVSQCAIQITFHQQNPDDVEYLGKSFAYGGLDFTPLLDKRIVPDGYDYVLLSNRSVSTGTGRTHSTSTTESHTHSRARGQTESEGINESVSLALSVTHSEGESSGWSSGTSKGRSFGINGSEGQSESDQTSESHAEGKSESSTHSDSRGRTTGAGESVRDGVRRGLPSHADYGQLDRTRSTSAGTSENHTSAVGSGKSETRTEGETHGSSTTQNRGANFTWSREESESTSGGTNSSNSLGLTAGAARGKSKSRATTESESEAAVAHGTSLAESENRTVSRGVSVAPLARHREEIVETGSLKRSVQDQIAEVMNLLASLPDRVVLVKVKGMGRPFLLKINDVLDPYEERFRDGKIGYVPRSLKWREHQLAAYLDRVFAAHAYNFVPESVPFEQPIIVHAPADRPRVTNASDEETVLA